MRQIERRRASAYGGNNEETTVAGISGSGAKGEPANNFGFLHNGHAVPLDAIHIGLHLGVLPRAKPTPCEQNPAIQGLSQVVVGTSVKGLNPSSSRRLAANIIAGPSELDRTRRQTSHPWPRRSLISSRTSQYGLPSPHREMWNWHQFQYTQGDPPWPSYRFTCVGNRGTHVRLL